MVSETFDKFHDSIILIGSTIVNSIICEINLNLPDPGKYKRIYRKNIEKEGALGS